LQLFTPPELAILKSWANFSYFMGRFGKLLLKVLCYLDIFVPTPAILALLEIQGNYSGRHELLDHPLATG